jgi:hypothetical protein
MQWAYGNILIVVSRRVVRRLTWKLIVSIGNIHGSSNPKVPILYFLFLTLPPDIIELLSMASGSVGTGTTKKFVGQYAFFSGSFSRGRMKSIEARPNSHIYARRGSYEVTSVRLKLCHWSESEYAIS